MVSLLKRELGCGVLTMNTSVFLIWLVTNSTSSSIVTEKRYVMPNMEVCIKAVEAAQVKIPTGGDAESTVSLFCAAKAYN